MPSLALESALAADNALTLKIRRKKKSDENCNRRSFIADRTPAIWRNDNLFYTTFFRFISFCWRHNSMRNHPLSLVHTRARARAHQRHIWDLSGAWGAKIPIIMFFFFRWMSLISSAYSADLLSFSFLFSVGLWSIWHITRSLLWCAFYA